jgi:hypothetical protein
MKLRRFRSSFAVTVILVIAAMGRRWRQGMRPALPMVVIRVRAATQGTIKTVLLASHGDATLTLPDAEHVRRRNPAKIIPLVRRVAMDIICRALLALLTFASVSLGMLRLQGIRVALPMAAIHA